MEADAVWPIEEGDHPFIVSRREDGCGIAGTEPTDAPQERYEFAKSWKEEGRLKICIKTSNAKSGIIQSSTRDSPAPPNQVKIPAAKM
jgi:hypothetical protein